MIRNPRWAGLQRHEFKTGNLCISSGESCCYFCGKVESAMVHKSLEAPADHTHDYCDSVPTPAPLKPEPKIRERTRAHWEVVLAPLKMRVTHAITAYDIHTLLDAAFSAEALREQLKQAQESNEQIEQHWRRMYDERWADAAKLSAEVVRLREAHEKIVEHYDEKIRHFGLCKEHGTNNMTCKEWTAIVARAALADPGKDSKEV